MSYCDLSRQSVLLDQYSSLRIILIRDYHYLQQQCCSFGSPKQLSSIQQASKVDEQKTSAIKDIETTCFHAV